MFPELWVLQRFKTVKVTFSLTQGHWQSCHLIGHTRYPISLLLELLEQELGAIYLLEMTKCLTGIFGKGLPWDIQNRTS